MIHRRLLIVVQSAHHQVAPPGVTPYSRQGGGGATISRSHKGDVYLHGLMAAGRVSRQWVVGIQAAWARRHRLEAWLALLAEMNFDGIVSIKHEDAEWGFRGGGRAA